MDISILSWNVCGLNERARRDAVHTLIDDVRPCIVCLQEAKLGVISQFTISGMLALDYSEFVDRDDQRVGRWTPDRKYTAKSAYKMLHAGSIP